jgi:gamma-glutamylcyclotransferase
MLYFSYGMNTNQAEMALRCPGATSLGHARLIDHVFRFAIHADVVKCQGAFVDGVLWEINNRHLKALDSLEGFPHYYNRRALRVAFEGRTVMAETYYMQPGRLDSEPSRGYFTTVLEGYQQHNIPLDQLYNSQEVFG